MEIMEERQVEKEKIVKYGRKVSWRVKRYRKYRKKASWIVIRYGQYGRKVSWIAKRYGKNSCELWKDMGNMEESQVK
jgi:hypothetical protein